jgi:phosphomannomutase
MLAALHVLAALGEQERPLAEIARSYERYASSGEINSTVEDQSSIVERVRAWADVRRAGIDELDGLTVTAPQSAGEMWWFNVRASNTEPLLRLNVEAGDRETMIRVRDEVLGLIRGAAAPARDEEELPE